MNLTLLYCNPRLGERFALHCSYVQRTKMKRVVDSEFKDSSFVITLNL
jgi:hypothetical protein